MDHDGAVESTLSGKIFLGVRKENQFFKLIVCKLGKTK